MAQSAKKGKTILGLGRPILGKTQLKPTNTMGKVEKSIENGPSRKDKYRT